MQKIINAAIFVTFVALGIYYTVNAYIYAQPSTTCLERVH